MYTRICMILGRCYILLHIVDTLGHTLSKLDLQSVLHEDLQEILCTAHLVRRCQSDTSDLQMAGSRQRALRRPRERSGDLERANIE